MILKMQTNKTHQNLDSRITAWENGYVYVVSIPWIGQKEYWWNETCADILEVFGLPGDRYTSHPAHDKMDFNFKSQKDADLCKILISDRI